MKTRYALVTVSSVNKFLSQIVSKTAFIPNTYKLVYKFRFGKAEYV